MKRVRRWSVALLGALLLLLAAIPAQGIVVSTDAPASAPAHDYAYVRFADPPLAVYDGSVTGYAATKPAPGQKLSLNSAAAQQYSNRLTAQRETYKNWLVNKYPQVQVVNEYAVTYNGIALKLNGASLGDIQRGPGVAQAQRSTTYHKAMNASHGVIHTAALWNALGGQANAGAGIKVGVIDSGIDQSHPFLSDAGMTAPTGFPKGDTRFTSNKVIVAKVFNQDPHLTAEAIDDHGTHVSGTIAGRAGTVAPMAANLSGVAPGAFLGNYNVFPGDVADADDVWIAKAVEEAVKDGMDVLNLSLGGPARQGGDILTMTVDAAVDAGVVVAVAAGNEGPGLFTVGSPGTASKVITVAAVTNAHQFANWVHGPALPAGTLAKAGDGNGNVTATVTGTYDVWADHAGGDKLACAPITGTPLAGKIALIQRGTCTFTEKINNAAAAGAMAVVIYQRDDLAGAPPIPMSTPGVTIPAVMVDLASGQAMVAWTGDRTITIEPSAERPAPAGNLADFSSWGPTPDYMLKPDVAAVGVDVYSSVPGGGYSVFAGTSMATPHVAGSAALMLAYTRAHGLGWGPAEIKAALMGTAHAAADSDEPLFTGAGVIDLARVVNPPALAMPSSLSFGLVRPVGNHMYMLPFTLKNTTAGTQTYTLTTDPAIRVMPSSVTLGAGQSAKVMAMVIDRGTPTPGQTDPDLRSGFVNVASGAGNIRLPYLYVIDYNQ